MTIQWTGFPAAVAATASDVLVGLAGGSANARFLVSSLLLVANNLDDVADTLTAFNNISPLTTKGDLLWWDGTNNNRLAIGSINEILAVGASSTPGWIAFPGLLAADNLSDLASAATARTNIGLGAASAVAFGLTTGTGTTASATPGTLRAIIGAMSNSNTTMTSGNVVGVRGVVTVVGTSTAAFVYGAQGKMVATGTLASGQFQAGVFGQADFSAATINGGQFAPLWGDFGTSVGTATDASGMYGVAMTNTTGMKIYAQDYRYGDASFWQSLQGSPSFFAAAGTSSGSAGFATGCNAPKVLEINVNGTTYYVPAFAQNT